MTDEEKEKYRDGLIATCKVYCHIDYDDDMEILELMFDVTMQEMTELIPNFDQYSLTSRQKLLAFVSKKTRTREKQRIVKITEYPESQEKNTVEISNARKTFAEIQKEETAAATEEAVSISNRATKKVLENYSTTEEIETKITASKEAVEAGVAYTLKNYYTSVQMDSLIKATKEEISQEVKHVEENSMHNYVVNGDFSNGLDDNWYNSNETNMLHAGADINMHFFTLRNVSFEDGSISGTLTFKQPLEVGSDGKLTKWSTATLGFKRGILVSGTWSNG